ncbi:unnamed protein product [Rotaria magnacalcarata]|uniref:LysM domain-containing protein n=1 Tax=Rotaria magnacalcarata TaxID=392030 RepID=A0A8S3HKB5_9BILA|nr:unnamed protein product [Rotaria magnacalcarata]CAF5178948.1 unnamed protein product [Rotaria magnacalcarata]CAF5182144.1 unnamed protein product [Rotaria magnacalcarata]
MIGNTTVGSDIDSSTRNPTGFRRMMSQYVVKAGDNLWDIAEKLLGDGHRHEEIQRINNLTSADIRPGQILMIPGQGHGATNHVTTSHSNISHGNTSISVCKKV